MDQNSQRSLELAANLIKYFDPNLTLAQKTIYLFMYKLTSFAAATADGWW